MTYTIKFKLRDGSVKNWDRTDMSLPSAIRLGSDMLASGKYLGMSINDDNGSEIYNASISPTAVPGGQNA